MPLTLGTIQGLGRSWDCWAESPNGDIEMISQTALLKVFMLIALTVVALGAATPPVRAADFLPPCDSPKCVAEVLAIDATPMEVIGVLGHPDAHANLIGEDGNAYVLHAHRTTHGDYVATYLNGKLVSLDVFEDLTAIVEGAEPEPEPAN